MQKISIKNSHVVNHRYFRSKDEPKQSKGLLWPTLPVLSCPANGRNRRVSPIAECPGEGRFTEPTVGAQSWPRERVLMPCRYRRPHSATGWERFLLFCRSSARHSVPPAGRLPLAGLGGAERVTLIWRKRMFSHIMIGSNDIARSKKFYDALF